MAEIDWSEAPNDSEYVRHWMNRVTFFKSDANGFWFEWVGAKWIPTAMCNAVHESLVKRAANTEKSPATDSAEDLK